ncbi:MAG TPA: S41 family peptidase [Pyrinomonadaceae bacterium]|jgi:Tol biopolymer transport system component/C-terminal processing protease CtpA/Prc
MLSVKLSARILFVLISLCLSVVSAFAQASSMPYLTEPSLAPDRREILFVSGGDIWSAPAGGGTAQILVAHPATESRPLFSPDGRRLAFVSNRTGNGDIYVLNLETNDLSRLTFDDSSDNLDAWSRDGNWIYFSSSSRDVSGMSDIFRVAATGGTPQQVSSDRYTSEFYAAPSPDGNVIAFTARGIANGQWWRKGRSHIDESEIWLKTGDNYEQLTQRGAKQLWTMWSADGSRIFYVSDRGGAQNVWTQPLRGQARQLTNFTDGRVLWASISYDGKQIVFERNFKIWTMNADSGKASEIAINLRGLPAGALTERVNLSSQIREIALSPDGKKIAVVARGEIFAASSKDGGEAARVTNTVAPESFAAWSPDSRRLVYSSEREGRLQIFQYDFATETESNLTKTGDDFSPVYSPDGKFIAFIRNARSLWIYDTNTKQERELCKFYTDAPPLIGKRTIAWSPDNKWLAFLTYAPETRSYTNVSVVPATGGGAAQPLSFIANSNSGSLSWSPDNSFILFDTNQRTEEGSLARIDLRLRTPKFREDQFRDLFRQENPQDRPRPSPSPSPQASPSPIASPSPEDTKSNEIVFENIRRRLSLLRPGVNVNGQVISPDGKTLLILASAENQFNLYTVPLDELATDQSAKQITSTANFKSDAQFSPDSKEVYYIENGRVNIVALERREIRPLALNLEMNVNFAQEKMEVFKQGWRFLRDNFYDDKYHGADWNAVEKTYEPLISGARTNDEVRRLMSLMVGELNASHLGVSGNPAFTATPIGKLGLRFDRSEYEAGGRLKITEIIALSPVDITRNVKVGEYLISVDGVRVDARTNLDELLENKVGKRVELEISASPDGSNKREVIVKPVTTGAEKNLLYRQWVEANRAYVERISGGKLGYVHLPDMGSGSLAQLYVDLDVQNQGREGVVVDIRNNSGGFINPYVIDVLARRGYLNMKERGLWTVPARTALGQRALERPTVLVINQHSLSDAEDFTEGYRALKLGKVVGEPTAGWIIFTWNVNTFEGTTVRLPRQLVTGGDGKNMELNPRPVDVPVTRPVGESLTGKDSQLDAAVRELLRRP